jgi:hypothetical protein
MRLADESVGVFHPECRRARTVTVRCQARGGWRSWIARAGSLGRVSVLELELELFCCLSVCVWVLGGLVCGMIL